MAHITHPFDDTLVGGYDATNLTASTVLDPSVVFDYDASVPLSLNGMLSTDEPLLGNLDEMDASSAAAAAASLDAFLADQPNNVPIVGMMPSPHTQSAMNTATATSVPSTMSMPQQQPYPTHPQHHQAAVAVPQVGMQLAAGYPGYNIPPPPHPRHSRAVGSHIQSLSTPPSASLFHYPTPSYGTAGARSMPSYPAMPAHQQVVSGYMMSGDMASPTPSYGYPAYTGNAAGVPTGATISPTPIVSSTVSSPVSEVTPLTPPLSGVPPPLNTDLASVTSPPSPQSPSSSSDNESSSTRATAAAAVAAATAAVAANKDASGTSNRKRKNRGNADKDDTPKKPITEEEIQESKRQQRLMRNRASAQLSRERKKVYMKKLEGQLKELQQQNLVLSQQLAQLKSENASLRARSESLPTQAGFVYGSGSYPGSPESHSSDGSTSPEYGYTPAPHAAYTHGAVSHKRTRMAAHHHTAAHHQMFQQIPPRVRAAGVVMFALMMSFTIFYNMAGIDFTAVKTEPMSPGSPQASSPVVFQSRVLHDDQHVSHVSSLPANEAEGSSSTGAGGMPISPKHKQRRTVGFAGVHTPVTSTEPVALPPYAGADEYALVKPELPTTPAITPSSPIVVVKSEPSEAKALELYDESPSSDEDDASSVHSVPSTRTASVPGDYDLFQQWKKMIVDANLTLDMHSSYMFCPGAIQLRPQVPVKAKATAFEGDNTKESGIHSRLRRAGLPLPNSTEAEQLVAEAQARLSPDNNRLRFWVPTQSVLAGGDWDTNSFPSKVGLTEIECQVSGIRPVVFNTATPTTA